MEQELQFEQMTAGLLRLAPLLAGHLKKLVFQLHVAAQMTVRSTVARVHQRQAVYAHQQTAKQKIA